MAGILRDKTTNDKSIHIPNSNKQNYPFWRSKILVDKFIHQIVKKINNQNSIKIPKVKSQRLRERVYKTLGTSIIYKI